MCVIDTSYTSPPITPALRLHPRYPTTDSQCPFLFVIAVEYLPQPVQTLNVLVVYSAAVYPHLILSDQCLTVLAVYGAAASDQYVIVLVVVYTFYVAAAYPLSDQRVTVLVVCVNCIEILMFLHQKVKYVYSKLKSS